jgi:hypothetical protein
MNKTIFYHEDLYRQIELVPEENYFAANRFIEQLSPPESSIYGINTINVRSPQKVSLLDRKIKVEEIGNILTPISLSYSENVNKGYGQSSWKDQNTVVWGFEQFGLFVKKKATIIEAIWLSDSLAFPQLKTSQHLARAIFSISKPYSLILIDWNKELVCRFRSEIDVKVYLFQNLSFDS